MNGIPEDFEFDSLPEDFDHFEPILEKAMHRMPLFETAGVHTFFNGPESFTPDDKYYLGEAPELRNYWVAAGYNSIGIVSSGGAGHGAGGLDGRRCMPPFDLVGCRHSPRPAVPEEPALSEGTGERNAGASLRRSLSLTGRWKPRGVCAARRCMNS